MIPFNFAKDHGAFELVGLDDFPPGHPYVIIVSQLVSTYTGYEGSYGKSWARQVFVFESHEDWAKAALALYQADPNRKDVWAFKASKAIHPVVSLDLETEEDEPLSLGQRVRRLGRVLGCTHECALTAVHEKPMDSWVLRGCTQGDLVLSMTKGVATLKKALDRAEGWLSPELIALSRRDAGEEMSAGEKIRASERGKHLIDGNRIRTRVIDSQCTHEIHSQMIDVRRRQGLERTRVRSCTHCGMLAHEDGCFAYQCGSPFCKCSS